MSAALFIALEREIPGFDPFVNGKAVSNAERRLGRLAKQLGVTPLMEFFSQNPDEIAAFLEGEGGEVDELDLPEETWFPASDGLATVDALLAHLDEHPDALPESDDVATDLRAFQAVLRRAADEGVGWRLEVDF